MKKFAILFSTFGSSLAAYGLSCWELTTQPARFIPDLAGNSGPSWDMSAGWTSTSKFEIAVGVGLFVWGMMLHRGSK
jgi:hypothetical protein